MAKLACHSIMATTTTITHHQDQQDVESTVATTPQVASGVVEEEDGEVTGAEVEEVVTEAEAVEAVVARRRR